MTFPPRPPVTDDSTNLLHERLVAVGVPVRIAGDISADLGDMTRGLEKIQSLFARIAAGIEVKEALEDVESECRDHLLGHLKSIRKTTKRLRRIRRRSKAPRPAWLG